jgi:GxxExxY protein
VKDDSQRDELNTLTHTIIGAAIEVHRLLGPCFLEAAYEEALSIELAERGIPFTRQVDVTLKYKGRPVGSGRVDILVNDLVIVELKAVDTLAPLYTAQVLSYLRLTGCRLGLLINFNVAVLRDGVKRIAL